MQRLTLLKLADNHNEDTGRCDPSIPYIAGKTGQDVKTVRESLKSLNELGLVEIQPRSGKKTNYFLKIGRLLSFSDQQTLFDTNLTPDKPSHKIVKKVNFEEKHMQVAAWMAGEMLQIHNGLKVNYENWADTVRKLEKIDGHQINDIVSVWAWIINHDDGKFRWPDACRTPMKLRNDKDGLTYFQIIKNQMSREEYRRNVNQRAYKESLAEFAERESQALLARP